MTQADDTRYPLVGPAVSSRPQARISTDLSDWVDLMEVVETLCPVWPAPERQRGETAEYKL